MAMGVAYSFVASVVALPPALFLWDRVRRAEGSKVAALVGRERGR